MTQRLPTVGSDSGTWASILNGFLGVAHNADGTLKNLHFNVKDYGATGDGSTDDRDAIQAAVDAAAVTGGVVHAPPGTYRINSVVNWASKVSLVGAGIGRTIFKMYGAAAFQRGGLVGTPITDCVFQDLEVDGSNQTGTAKAFYVTFCKRFTFRRVYVHDTAATGFGCDFMVDSVYDSCIAENCGRLGETSSPGCSGFGIGTGEYEVETICLVNCIARGNKRYGVFVERQGNGSSGYSSLGPQIIGGYYEGNYRGIGDNGVRGLVVQGAVVNANVDTGIYIGKDAAPNGGYDGLIIGNQVIGNGAEGIELDFTDSTALGGYVVRGNTCRGNTNYGILSAVSGVLPNVTIEGNECYANGLGGIRASSGVAPSGLQDFAVASNRCWNNGQRIAAPGIDIQAALLRAHIVRNTCFDNQEVKTQTYGLDIPSGYTTTDSEIRDNDFRGNATAPLRDANTASGTPMTNNLGINPGVWETIGVGASPWTYTAGAQPEELHFLTGTISTIAVGGINIAVAIPAYIRLEPDDQATVTYSVAPGLKRRKL